MAAPDSIAIFGVLIGLYILLGLWSGIGPHGIILPALRAPTVGNLFLGVRLHAAQVVGDSGAGINGHVIALGPRTVTFLSPEAVGRGNQVTLDLGPTPNLGLLAAEVVLVRALPGQPAAFLVSARFADLPAARRLPLICYVRQLARHRRPRAV